jgi:beta-barrel assembly-enhancing protease
VLNTSEFNDVKARIAMLHGHRKLDAPDPNRPTLRHAPGSGSSPADSNGNGTGSGKSDDDRPTLKRRDSGN